MLTVPNLLTALRALGIPLFLYLVAAERYTLAVITLMVAGATDYLDGKLARLLNQASRFGELFDPLVDRLYIASVLIAMYLSSVVPVWVLLLVLIRDVALFILLLLMRRRGIAPFTVTFLGKAATFNLLYALPLLLLTATGSGVLANLAFIFGWAFAGWGIGLYLLTGVGYARTGLKALRVSRG